MAKSLKKSQIKKTSNKNNTGILEFSKPNFSTKILEFSKPNFSTKGIKIKYEKSNWLF